MLPSRFRAVPLLAALVCLAAAPGPSAAEPDVVLLWPDGAPGAVGDTDADKPRITISVAPQPNGAAVVVCPGGGYGHLAVEHEGREVAAFLNAHGVTAAVLQYRIAPRYGHPAPGDDVRRALRWVRHNAGRLGIDPARIGVMGFSAGGHLAATATTLWDEGDPGAKDPIDRASSRPDFAVLCYPVITMTDPYTHRGSRRNLLGESPSQELIAAMSLERRVTSATPPTFLFHTGTDTAVPVENSLLFYSALRAHDVPGELHVYRDARHGVGLDRAESIRSWPGLLADWMKHLGLLAPTAPSWIWLGEGGENERIWMRREFDVAGEVEEALLTGTCDNQAAFFINGNRALVITNWEEPRRADVKRFLRPGRNVIAVDARNEGGPGGLLAQLRLRTTAGAATVISDASWKVSTDPGENWRGPEPESDDDWTAATVIAPIGGGAWERSISQAVFDAAAEPVEITATPVDRLQVLDGFQAELLYTVPKEEQGSWVAITVDDRGRLYTCDQYGSLYRIVPSPIGSSETSVVERVEVDAGGAHGLLWAFDSLYVVRAEGNGRGLYRVRDTDGDDVLDDVKFLRDYAGGGEHGPHAVVLSPDGESLYVLGGNHTDLPHIASSVVPTVWGEDQLLPRMWDANGHAKGRLAPAGWVCRTDPDGKDFELVSIGYRNEFDMAFNAAGDLFTYDADMEWDVGSPWYRPTRVCHVTSGSEFGWRSGTGKWPADYPDSLPSVVDVGPGSPTGIAFGYGARFPEAYQRALYICDWSYGKLYAVHLEPDGSTYGGTLEQFVAGAPLPLADVIVNPHDGALYFVTGGRRTQSGLYRVTHRDRPAVVDPKPAPSDVRDLRRAIEGYHRPRAGGVEIAWKNLGHEDRFVRYAARVALEHQPLDEWRGRAGTGDAWTAIQSVIALARQAEPDRRAQAIEGLGRLDWNALSVEQRVALCRAYALVFIRMAVNDDGLRARVAATLSAAYPAKSYPENRELSALLTYLEVPGTAERTLALRENAPTQEEQVHYSLVLRNLKTGWTLDQRRQYFEWFGRAASFRGGHSFRGFLANIKNEAIALLDEETKGALGDALNPVQVQDVVAVLPKPKGPGKDWTIDELAEGAEAALRGRDFENGHRMFTAARCFQCHRFDGVGGAVGPDLTGVGGRFSPRDLLESIIEPSKTISDQYQATVFELRAGEPVVGRIINAGGDGYTVNVDMFDPTGNRGVRFGDIVRTYPSDISMMPVGLLGGMNREEVYDLMAYLLSRGDASGPMFAK